MKIIRQKKDLNRLFSKINSFSFVPTMGGLHKGHEFLIKKARKKTFLLCIIAGGMSKKSGGIGKKIASIKAIMHKIYMA